MAKSEGASCATRAHAPLWWALPGNPRQQHACRPQGTIFWSSEPQGPKGLRCFWELFGAWLGAAHVHAPRQVQMMGRVMDITREQAGNLTPCVVGDFNVRASECGDRGLGRRLEEAGVKGTWVLTHEQCDRGTWAVSPNPCRNASKVGPACSSTQVSRLGRAVPIFGTAVPTGVPQFGTAVANCQTAGSQLWTSVPAPSLLAGGASDTSVDKRVVRVRGCPRRHFLGHSCQ